MTAAASTSTARAAGGGAGARRPAVATVRASPPTALGAGRRRPASVVADTEAGFAAVVSGPARSAGHTLAAPAALGAIVVWSTNALAAGAALDRLTLLQVLALQFGAAALVFWIARGASAAAKDRRPGDRSRLTTRSATVAVVGLTGTIALQYLAFATAPLVAANAVAYAWPLMVAAWAALAADRHGSRSSLALALVGFAGVVLIFAQRGGGSGAANLPLLGYAAALGSALAMAWYTLAVGKIAARRTDLLLAATLAGAAITIPAALAQGAPWSPLPAILLGLYTGLGPMAAGYALWTHAMSHPSGARLAPIAYGTPLLSTLVLLASGERLPALGLLGCALIITCAAGVVIGARGRSPDH